MAKKSITKCIQSLLLAFLILAGFHQWKPQAEPLKQLLVVSDDLTHGHIKKNTMFMVSRRIKNCLSLTLQFCKRSWICLPCLLFSIGSSIPCQPACLPATYAPTKFHPVRKLKHAMQYYSIFCHSKANVVLGWHLWNIRVLTSSRLSFFSSLPCIMSLDCVMVLLCGSLTTWASCRPFARVLAL